MWFGSERRLIPELTDNALVASCNWDTWGLLPCTNMCTLESQLPPIATRNTVNHLRSFPPSLAVWKSEGQGLEDYIMWYCCISNIIQEDVQLQRSYRSRKTPWQGTGPNTSLEANHCKMAMIQEAGLGTMVWIIDILMTFLSWYHVILGCMPFLLVFHAAAIKGTQLPTVGWYKKLIQSTSWFPDLLWFGRERK